MGFPPPPDGLPLDVQGELALDATFELGPPVASLCGFTIPSFSFSFSISIPFALPPFPPKFNFSIGLNCDLNNPLDVSGGIDFGGGRKATFDTSADDNAEI